jgi:Magnesium chelatase, subunit ChlI
VIPIEWWHDRLYQRSPETAEDRGAGPLWTVGSGPWERTNQGWSTARPLSSWRWCEGEALQTIRIHSIAGLTGDRTAFGTTRPFRAPHTISDAGLVGGGQVPMPGDVSRAHHGVRFLDAWPEFRRHVLEVFRQPLEEGDIYI